MSYVLCLVTCGCAWLDGDAERWRATQWLRDTIIRGFTPSEPGRQDNCDAAFLAKALVKMMRQIEAAKEVPAAGRANTGCTLVLADALARDDVGGALPVAQRPHNVSKVWSASVGSLDYHPNVEFARRVDTDRDNYKATVLWLLTTIEGLATIVESVSKFC